MVRYLETHYYTTASRYTTSAFLRMKLGRGALPAQMKPHIFETREEAQAFLARGARRARRVSACRSRGFPGMVQRNKIVAPDP